MFSYYYFILSRVRNLFKVFKMLFLRVSYNIIDHINLKDFSQAPQDLMIN